MCSCSLCAATISSRPRTQRRLCLCRDDPTRCRLSPCLVQGPRVCLAGDHGCLHRREHCERMAQERTVVHNATSMRSCTVRHCAAHTFGILLKAEIRG